MTRSFLNSGKGGKVNKNNIYPYIVFGNYRVQRVGGNFPSP